PPSVSLSYSRLSGDRYIYESFFLVGPSEGGDPLDGSIIDRHDDLGGAGKGRLAEGAGEGFVLRRKVSVVVRMGMIEGFEPGCASVGVVNDGLQFFVIHRVGDGSGARVGLRVERMQLIVDIYQSLK